MYHLEPCEYSEVGVRGCLGVCKDPTFGCLFENELAPRCGDVSPVVHHADFILYENMRARIDQLSGKDLDNTVDGQPRLQVRLYPYPELQEADATASHLAVLHSRRKSSSPETDVLLRFWLVAHIHIHGCKC